MTVWRIEERHVSPMGEVRWLAVSGAYHSQRDAELALDRLNSRQPEDRRKRVQRRIVEVKQ